MSYCSNESYMSRSLQARLVELDKITSTPTDSTRRMTTQTTDEPNRHRKTCVRGLRSSTDYPRNYDLIFTDFATASNAVAKLIEANESRAKDFATALYDAESEFSQSYQAEEGRSPIDHLLYDAKATTVDKWNASQDRLISGLMVPMSPGTQAHRSQIRTMGSIR